MKQIKFTFFLFTLIALLGGNFLIGQEARAGIELVKSADFNTVYYIDADGIRHIFPNQITYQSWYGSDFSKIITVGNDFLAQYPLGKNITIRPGTYLVKIRTSPEVYAVEPGGVLRHVDGEAVAEKIYGPNWAGRIVDVPDVFFSNYTIGEEIDKETEIPDGVVYYDQEIGKYYYKRNDLIQPFASEAAVKANNFELADAITAGYAYLFAQRSRTITKLDKNVFNPTAEQKADRRDCENKNLKAAVVFLTNQSHSAAEIDKIQKIKKEITARFEWATDNLSTIDVDYPTIIMSDDGYLTAQRNDGTYDIKNEAINTFYDDNPDAFDFLIIWTNFKIPSENTNEIASFTPITNRQKGINRDPDNWSRTYGSQGKLKGVIIMGNIDKYHPETETGLNESLNLVLHEILHQWSAYIDFIDSNGQQSFALLRDNNYQHWSYYAGFISPLGGSGWIDNGDGTYTSGLAQLKDSNLRPFSKLDLYLMGLIPYQLMDPVFYVVPDEPGAVGNTIKGTAKWVTVDQIIAANDKVSCSKY